MKKLIRNKQFIFWLIFGLIIIAVILTRFWGLDNKPLHHDESLHAYYSWVLRTSGQYQYTPMLHGPMLYYLTVIAYFIFGITNYTAHIAPAFFGVVIVIALIGLRKYLSDLGVILAATLILVSPSMMYFSRFLRHDIFIETFTLLIVLFMFRFLEKHRILDYFLVIIFAVLAYTTMESFYIVAFIFGTYLIIRYFVERNIKNKSGQLIYGGIKFLKKRPHLIIYGVLVFIVIACVLFTTLFTNPAGIYDGFIKSITYWLAQHSVHRGGQPVYYYMILLGLYESGLVILGICATIYYLKNKDYFANFMIYWFWLAFVIYSWAGEKMPWLSVHLVLPLIILVAKFVSDIIQNHKIAKTKKLIIIIITILGIALSSYNAWRLSFKNPANPVEMYVYVQTNSDVVRAIDDIKQNASQLKLTKYHLYVENEVSWPYAWYLRNWSNYTYFQIDSFSADPAEKSYVMVSADSYLNNLTKFNNYNNLGRYKLRWWWLPEHKFTFSQLQKYFWQRITWNELGSYDFYLLAPK